MLTSGDTIEKLNNRNKKLSLVTYDFCILYAHIQSDKLKNVMRELISLCFKGRKKQFIAVTKFGAK